LLRTWFIRVPIAKGENQMNQETRKWIMLAMLPVAVAVVAAAGIAFVSCSTPSKPVVALSAPVSGSQFIEGQEVIVQSTATDAKGVARVQLAVDNIVVSSDKLASPKTATTMIQKWQASSAGPHMLTVRAFNGDNVGSDPVNVTVMVLPKPAPTVAPTATSTPAPLPPGPCANNAALVADVTVPDGTVLAPGQQFNKIWRVLNSGSCPWNANYQFVFVGGEQMAAAGVLAVPYTNPGAITDLRVPMTAPTVPGPHVGRWQLRGTMANCLASCSTFASTCPIHRHSHPAPARQAFRRSLPQRCPLHHTASSR
jgi:hypothetical protein